MYRPPPCVLLVFNQTRTLRCSAALQSTVQLVQVPGKKHQPSTQYSIPTLRVPDATSQNQTKWKRLATETVVLRRALRLPRCRVRRHEEPHLDDLVSRGKPQRCAGGGVHGGRRGVSGGGDRRAVQVSKTTKVSRGRSCRVLPYRPSHIVKVHGGITISL